jgi:hypothetical protein
MKLRTVVIVTIFLALILSVSPLGYCYTNTVTEKTANNDPELRTRLQQTQPPSVMGATLVGYGTNGSSYARGSTAQVYMLVQNMGNVSITSEIIKMTASKWTFLGYVPVTSKSDELNETIAPGQTSNLADDFAIPESYNGLSTEGSYRVHVDIVVWGYTIGGFDKDIQIT